MLHSLPAGTQHPVPKQTKLLEFSPAGRFVTTFSREGRQLTLRHVDTGQPAFTAEVPCFITEDENSSRARASYGFSADDRWLAITINSPENPQLVIVDLDSSNARTIVTELPPNPDGYYLQPAFSADGRYLTYSNSDGAVLYDVPGRREELRVSGLSSPLGQPTRKGKWLFDANHGIECWDVVQKRRDDDFPTWPRDYSMRSTSLAPDEQAISALCVAESRKFPRERIFLNRCDLNTRKIETAWEYAFPTSAHLFWNLGSSGPEQFLLIKTLDDQGELVQDLLDINSGKLVVRYPRPISMLEEVSYSYLGQSTSFGAGLIHTVGRTGEIGIDSEHRILASKQIIRDTIWWKYFSKPLNWLGLRQGPPKLDLQFHSARTGELLERVALHSPYKPFEPVLAVHPSKPILAVVDEQLDGSSLQFWHMPPPKPWGWIVICALAGGVTTILVTISISKFRTKKGKTGQVCLEPAAKSP